MDDLVSKKEVGEGMDKVQLLKKIGKNEVFREVIRYLQNNANSLIKRPCIARAVLQKDMSVSQFLYSLPPKSLKRFHALTRGRGVD